MMIQILHAAFVYQSPDGEVEALRDVSFDVQEGKFCSIVGPSGCGKSTCCRRWRLSIDRCTATYV